MTTAKKTQADPTTTNTPEFRVSYPSVFKPRENELSGKEEYSVMALFKKGEDLTKLKNAAKAAMAKKFGADEKKWGKYRSPFRNQADKAKENDDGDLVLPDGMEEGAIFVNFKTTRQPGVVGPDVKPLMEEKEFYAGCYAIARVNAYAYDNKGRGVAFGLQLIQKTKDGDPLGGVRVNPEEAFSPIEGLGTEDTENPDDIMGSL